jgi:Putative beta-barrel porin-2, OmpL-like. bbp2
MTNCRLLTTFLYFCSNIPQLIHDSRASQAKLPEAWKIKMKRMVLAACLLTNIQAHAQDGGGIFKNSFSPFTISGYAEAYYGADFNNPIGDTKPSFLYSFNKNNEASVNLAFIKGSYVANRARANLALAAGSYMSANYATEPGILGNFYEGNVGIKLSRENNLWLDVGVFPSHIGLESAVGKNNWTLTRSIGADNTPYYESGAKIGYTSENEKWFVSALVLNGWQHIKPVEGGFIPSFGTQVTYKPSPRITLNSSTFAGSDKPEDARQGRYFHNFYGIFRLTDKFATTVDFDIGIEERNHNSSAMNTWYNSMITLRYTPTSKTAVAIRAEYYDDRHGVIIASNTPHGFKTWGFSTNFDYHITSNLLWRVEARTLSSRDNIFTTRDGSATDNNTFITTSLAVNF